MRRLLIILLALVAGVGTLGLLELSRPAPPPDTVEVVQSDTVRVLVFNRDMPRGTIIDTSGLIWQEQLRSAVSVSMLTSETADAPYPSDIVGKLVRRDVLAGEMVRRDDLVDRASGFMALTLSPGTRAVGLSVTAQKLAGGFILPEDRIDLIHTIMGDFDRDGRAGSFSQTILENIRVLAIGDTPTSRIAFRTPDQQENAASRTSEINMTGDTITLEMTEEQAEVLFSALASGQVSLALRSIDDHGPSRVVSVLGFEQPEPPAPVEVILPPEPPQQPPEPAPVVDVPEPPEPEPPKRSIRVISGGETTIVDVP
jgi:pilus assembly protein CpaB